MRLLGLGHPVLYIENTSYRFAPAPNQQLRGRTGGVRVTIDAEGLRDVSDWAGPADHHILFLGDSVTWGGTTIDDADTFAARTCGRLKATLGGSFLCGNAGVNGYGIDNMLARLAYDPAIRRADVIVAVVITGDAVRGLNDLHRTPFFSVRPSGPLAATWEAVGILTLMGATRLVHPDAADGYYPPDILPKGPDADAVATASAQRLVTALQAEEKENRKVLLVFSPIVPELDDPDRLPLTRTVRQVLAGMQASYLDLVPAVREARPLDGLYIDGVHLTRRGHEVYAAAIAAKLAPLLRPKE